MPEIENTIEDQCGPEFAIQAQLLEVETLEKKYDVADPSKDDAELDEEDDEDGESIYDDDEESDRAT
ncbi:hypothetical protein PHYBOEH_001464, partial [Phytophthora boehmeriae]